MNNIINELKKNNIVDKKISIAIMSSFLVLTLQYLILVVFSLIGTPTGNKVQLISKVIVGLLYLRALPGVLKRSKIKFIVIYFLAILIFLINYLLFPENHIYLNSLIFPLFFTCLPSLIYAHSMEDWQVLMNVMKQAAKWVFLIGVAIAILIISGFASTGSSYSMSLSYYMLLPAIIYLNDIIDRKKIKSGLIFIVSLLIILSLGARGPVMCVGVFVILKFISTLKDISYTKAILYILLLMIAMVGIIFLDKILLYLYEFLLSKGINSRSLRLFLRDGIYMSGRDAIYSEMIKEIFNKPFLGLGLASDRRILSGRNAYVHNIFIEVIMNFGIIIGALLSLFLLYLLVKNILIKDEQIYTLMIIWISIGFIHLLISSSYLNDFKFWIYLGLSLNSLKDSKINFTIDRKEEYQ